MIGVAPPHLDHSATFSLGAVRAVGPLVCADAAGLPPRLIGGSSCLEPVAKLDLLLG